MPRRLAKVNKTLHHEISNLMPRITKPEWGLVTVTDVLVSDDLRQAKIWISATPRAIKELNAMAPEIIRQLRPRLRYKYIPRLTFILDSGEINHLKELLEQIDES